MHEYSVNIESNVETEMKKFIVVPDSFKGTLSSKQICKILKEQIALHFPEATIYTIPVADGGEGSVDCFLSAKGGKLLKCESVNPFFEKICNERNLFNTLIISPPFCGKTTVLKDLAIKINGLNLGSILIIDERAEFENVQGINIDKILYSDKLYAFEYGVRSMSPSIVITDELVTKNDWLCAKKATDCGVKIIASCHAASIDDVKRKDYFIENVFERYVVLLSGVKPGILKSVYNGVFEEV